MAIHENLTRAPKQQLREIGWTKARELAKVARREGERFESAPWVHKAQVLPKELQAGGRATPDGEGNRSVGDYLLQAL